MAKQKKEDNRDVFDKALDYAPVVGGAVIGGAVGRKLGRRSAEKAFDKQAGASGRYSGADLEARSKAIRAGGFDGFATGVAGGGAYIGLPAAIELKKRRESRRK